jgi:hypothetical protein
MIKEMKVIVKCPVTNEDVVFELQQSSNAYYWYMVDTRLASRSSTTWENVEDAVKNILTLSPNK